MVRGNHELCKRGGQGWFRLIDPHPDAADCTGTTSPYSLHIDTLNLLIRGNPDSAEEYRQRAVLEVRAGRMAAARDDLARYLDLARAAPDRDQVKEQIQTIQHWLSSLN